jgi:hypothetical protein
MSILRFERRGEPLAPRWLFTKRLIVNLGLALAMILLSLVIGMAGYHFLEGSRWLDAFDQAAMILGGMGPYSEPKTGVGKFFSGLYALYCGLLLIGITGLILAPLFHRIMHHFHVPDEGTTARRIPTRKKTSNLTQHQARARRET